MTIDTQRVDCHLLADGQVALEARILLRQSSQIKEVALTTTPCISASGRGISLEDIQYPQGKELSPALTRLLMEKVSNILNLRNFEMEGILLRIYQIDVEAGQLTRQANASVTKFPCN